MSREKTAEDIELEKELFLAKQARISDEIKRLSRIFGKIDKKTKSAVKSLIENAAFMAITLADLQDDMNRLGVVSEYQNGENQWGTKKSPEVEIYNTMVKNHASIIKQLTDLLPPPATPEGKDDELDRHIKNRPD
jgi:hypothetical protein